uniref:Self-incompatibility-linked fibrinogen-like protein-B n=1 Tax=Ciona intestinalis TaxID=7719 RepID=B1Q457_CIOIN|nr:self-incompatibility-linked fibrinogen-like protein-B [Ciona intestinalis]BAG15917.1 self-incompatibility-linked fibrinogen-like protein-B [Ciona intestinalis]BAG15920.1 self-incompatibility-linked fibrinogen-like protein-B [Ciona intestinalis]BAN92378.1 self-incompatibility-linked fibrinogen-like protein-B [Ciona intestinalis]
MKYGYVFYIFAVCLKVGVISITLDSNDLRNVRLRVINVTKQISRCKKILHLRKARCAVSEWNKLNVTALRLPMKNGSRKYGLSTTLYADCDSIASSKSIAGSIYPIWLRRGYRFIYTRCDFIYSKIREKTGWVTFQQRLTGKVNFQRGWLDYVNGFGNPYEDYWVGLKNILSLTRQNTVIMYKDYSTIRPTLRIDMKGWDGFEAYVEYEKFTLYSDKSDYRIANLGKRTGTGYDFNRPDVFLQQHFITFDRKQEDKRFINPDCPGPNDGGWWFSVCSYANLNGPYASATENMTVHNIYWRYWFTINKNNSALKYVSMKMRYKA